MENNPEAGELFVANLLSSIRGCGGFRESSPNFVGSDCIATAQEAFKTEGYDLASDGVLTPTVLSNLSDIELTRALDSYVLRAQRGIKDAALIAGTGKDLLEAVAAHIIQERFGNYSVKDNFPTLLGQAFVAVGLATPQDKPSPDETRQKIIERKMFELGLAINQLRNREGTGHGRPWLPSISESDVKIDIEIMGTIAELLLTAHKNEKY